MSEGEVTEVYEIRPRKDQRGVDLISEALPFGSLWYSGPNAVESAAGYAAFSADGKPGVIKIFNAAGELLRETEIVADTRQRAQSLGGL